MVPSRELARKIAYCLRNPADAARRVWRRVRPMRRDYRSRFRMSLEDWMLYHQRHVVFEKCHWMGVRALKNPLDAWIMQEILWEVKPDFLIEIGSHEGGSTLYFAQLFDLIGSGTVISVDIDRSRFRVRHPRIVEITGDSAAPETVASVAALSAGRATLVVHDGDHEKAQVLRDLEAYSPLVSAGSYLIVEDGFIDLFRPGDGIGTLADGPLAAVEEFLARRPDFVADRERERYLLSCNPKGYLKRVR